LDRFCLPAAATPSGRWPSISFLYVHSFLDGCARYAPRWNPAVRNPSIDLPIRSNSCQVPRPLRGRRFSSMIKLSRSKSTDRWWSKAVNFISLFSLAAFRTPLSPWDTRPPLCVGCVLGLRSVLLDQRPSPPHSPLMVFPSLFE